MSALDALLGRILSNDIEIELSKGLNFKQGLQAQINPATGLTEVSFGSVAAHSGLTIADGIHGGVAFSFASAAARAAAVLDPVHDLYKFAVQTDTTPPTLWLVTSIALGAGSWQQVTLAAANPDPLAIFGSSALIGWYRGDAVTLGTGVSSWTDKSGNTNHLIQATGGSQPAYTASDGTLNNRGTLLGNGTSTYLNCVAMSVPATCYIWFIIKQVSWTLNSKFMNWPGSGSIIQATATPSLVYVQGSANPDDTGAAIGSWKRGYVRLDNTTADAIALGSNVKTGVACGRTAASNNTAVFSNWSGSSNWWSGACAEIAIVNRLPTGPELAAMDAYGSSYYLPSVLT